MRAKPPPPYSILKPETSSDSPSAKSKGVRLVSAIQLITHRANSGLQAIKREDAPDAREAPTTPASDIGKIRQATTTASLTSYERV